jgi:pyrimidine operon attenuation protein/uracil phosphoribosyltransferase
MALESNDSGRKAKVLMDSEQISRTLARMTHEIAEQAPELSGLALVGIQRRGVELAARLAELIESFYGVRPPTGAIDITFYRDDLDTRAGASSGGQYEQPVVHSPPYLRYQRQDHPPGGRRAVHRSEHPRRHRRPVRFGRPAAVRLAVLWIVGIASPHRPDFVARTCRRVAASRWWSV